MRSAVRHVPPYAFTTNLRFTPASIVVIRAITRNNKTSQPERYTTAYTYHITASAQTTPINWI